jgi:hypothetical protein
MSGNMQDIRLSRRFWRHEMTSNNGQFRVAKQWPIIKAAGIKGE